MSHLLPLSPESQNLSPTSKVEEVFIFNCRANEKCIELGIDKLHNVEIIRFFQAAREDALKATNEIIDLLTWRQSIGYEEVLNGYYPEYCSTIFYLYDVSHAGIPVLFYKAKNYLPLVDDADAILKQSIAVMGNIQRKYNYSKVILCIDKDGASTDNVSVEFAKQTISLFTRYFPETLHELLIFQSNFLLWSFWSLIKPFMESDTVQKVSILGEEEHKKVLKEKIGEHKLPPRLGGKNAKKEPERTGISLKSPPLSPTSSISRAFFNK